MEINIEGSVAVAKEKADSMGVELTDDVIKAMLNEATPIIARQVLVAQFSVLIQATEMSSARADDIFEKMMMDFHLKLLRAYLEKIEGK